MTKVPADSSNEEEAGKKGASRLRIDLSSIIHHRTLVSVSSEQSVIRFRLVTSRLHGFENAVTATARVSSVSSSCIAKKACDAIESKAARAK